MARVRPYGFGLVGYAAMGRQRDDRIIAQLRDTSHCDVAGALAPSACFPSMLRSARTVAASTKGIGLPQDGGQQLLAEPAGFEEAEEIAALAQAGDAHDGATRRKLTLSLSHSRQAMQVQATAAAGVRLFADCRGDGLRKEFD